MSTEMVNSSHRQKECFMCGRYSDRGGTLDRRRKPWDLYRPIYAHSCSAATFTYACTLYTHMKKYVHINTNTHTYTHTDTHTYTHTHLHTHTHTPTPTPTHTRARTPTHRHTHRRTHLYLHTRAHTQ